jgi:hypothetical protein
MNFNVYLRKNIGEKVTKTAETLHRSRNSIVSEALEEWLDRHVSSKWPKNFFDFEAVKRVPNFKKLRKELKSISEDPLE